jgi:hypothetical protein
MLRKIAMVRCRRNPQSRLRLQLSRIGAAAIVCLLWGLSLNAQSLEEELKGMRLEIQQLRQEVSSLREELRGKLPPMPPTESTHRPPAGAEDTKAAELLPVLQAQVAEQAQTKVESSSRFPVKIFGSIVSNTFLNTGEANWLDSPNIVPAGPPAGLPSGSFSSTLRQSRVGASVEGPAIGSMKSSGFFAMDFFGGIPNFQNGQVMGIPRLLYAFARLEGARTAIEVGQDHMILAPRNPTSLSAMAFPELFRSGNLYLRVPQARIEQKFGSNKAGEWQATLGILAPVAGDLVSDFLTFVPPNLAGERSRQPAVQARVAWSRRNAETEQGIEIGVSGHTGSERYVTGSVPSRAAALDLDARVGRIGFGGEFFIGKNIDAFGGSISQRAKSMGGFLEARLAATRSLDFNAGFGTDQLIDRNSFPALLTRNPSFFTNVIYRLTPEIATSFEYRWLSTVPAAVAARHNNHFGIVLAYSF